MKIIGYIWATDVSDNERDEPGEITGLIGRYMRKRRWSGPIQLEEPSEAFTDFHLRTCGGAVASTLRSGDVLIVPDQSYLFRTASQGIFLLQNMHSRGVSVHLTDLDADIAQGAHFERFISILAPLASFEPELSKVRAKSIKQRDRLKNRYLGGNPPIGFKVDDNGELRADAGRSRIAKLVLRLRAKKLSLRAISVELQKRGIEISHSGVRSVLQSVQSNAEEFHSVE